MVKKKVKAKKVVKSKQRKKKSIQDKENSKETEPRKPDTSKDRDALGRLQKGCTPQNPKGRPVNAFSLTTLLLDILRKNKGKSKETQGEALMKALLKYAKKGNSKLMSIIMDRVDGKVPDRLFTTETNPLSDIDEEKLNRIINAGRDQADVPE